MLLAVEHVTRYRYAAPVKGVVQSLRLTPAAFEGQKVRAWSVEVAGGRRGGRFRDGSGDTVEGWTLPGPLDTVEVRVAGLVETIDLAGVLRGHREAVPPLAWLRATPATRADTALTALARAAAGAGDALAVAHALAAAVAEAIRWTPGATQAQTTAAEALARGEGVCQDHAQALVAAARAGGIPARYVAGYMFDGGAPGEAAHAWAELHVEGLGWVGFDAANRCCPDARYIRLGSGLDAADAAPIRGIARGGAAAERLDVTVRVAEAQGQGQQ
jgi:transglutaminase-like putative cysteine protease